MLSKRTAVIGLVTTGLALSTVAIAHADGGVGFTSVVIGLGQINGEIDVRKGTDVVTAEATNVPGGMSGWHSHPGAVIVAVRSGAMTIYKVPVGGGACTRHTYTAGQVFVERPGNQLNAVNLGTVDAVVVATYLNVPHGQPARIDRPNPGNCP